MVVLRTPGRRFELRDRVRIEIAQAVPPVGGRVNAKPQRDSERRGNHSIPDLHRNRFSVTVNESLDFPFFLNFGRRTFFLAISPRVCFSRSSKKFLNAVPRLMIAICGAFLVTSSIHGNRSRLMLLSVRRRTS